MNTRLNGTTPLPHLGILRAEGEDAAKFLQGQLTQDFALLGLGEARLAAFLSAKGRMQASFIGFKRSTTEILLVCSADLLEATRKRLSMFVLRAKVKLTDASADFALYGVAGDAIQLIAGDAGPAWAKHDIDAQSLVFLYPAGEQPRALWIAPVGTPAPAAPALSLDLWRWGEVHSGVATLSAPVVDAFVPQMLNYESVGGVNFKKGCYPGQEVVARSQFRGTLKRRTYIAHAGATLAVGDEVFQAVDPAQPCGTVVQVAPAPGGGFDALVSLQIAAALAGGLHAVSAHGPALALLPLPYPLLEDI
jgi:hypothetical protein